jgi:hypothetical protein
MYGDALIECGVAAFDQLISAWGYSRRMRPDGHVRFRQQRK